MVVLVFRYRLRYRYRHRYRLRYRFRYRYRYRFRFPYHPFRVISKRSSTPVGAEVNIVRDPAQGLCLGLIAIHPS